MVRLLPLLLSLIRHPVMTNPRQYFWLWVVGSAIVGFGLGWYCQHRQYVECRDERTALLRDALRNQRTADSLHFAGLAERDRAADRLQLAKHRDTITDLREKAARDSLRRLSELESVRAVNRYIHSGGAPPGRQHSQRSGVRP